MMRKTTLEKQGIQVSRLGFGIMRLPTKEDGAIDHPKSMEMIDYAYQNGVNYFDTAWPYHGGESELVTGEALSRYPRESFYLADKLPIWACKTKEEAAEVFAKQLEKCKVEYFDFYLLHALHKKRWQHVQQSGILDLMRQYRDAGKIRSLGFSFHDNIEVFPGIVDALDWDFAQIQINYIDETLLQADALYQKLCDKQIPCIVMEPVRGGFLANLPEQAAAPVAACPSPAAKQWPGHAAWALRWCLGHDNMAIILSGMSTMEQVQQNVALFSQAPPLDAVELDALHQARDVILAAKTLPCTGCNYCKCPHGVYIPDIFRIYNHYKLFQNGFRSKTSYSGLTEAHSARACIKCGACIPLCPQKIDIPAELQRVHGVLRDISNPLHPDSPPVV